MTAPEEDPIWLRLVARRLKAQGDDVKVENIGNFAALTWRSPTSPFEYFFACGSEGTWFWQMRNDVVDPPGQWTSDGDLPVSRGADPFDVALTIHRFIAAESSQLNDDEE